MTPPLQDTPRRTQTSGGAGLEENSNEGLIAPIGRDRLVTVPPSFGGGQSRRKPLLNKQADQATGQDSPTAWPADQIAAHSSSLAAGPETEKYDLNTLTYEQVGGFKKQPVINMILI